MVYRLLKNPCVVDVAWSIGIMMSGFIYFSAIPITPRNTVVSALLTLWALRLAGYLWYTRIRQGHLDKRYTELSHHWTIHQPLGFFLHFQGQGLLIFLISLVFYWISNSNNPYLTLMDDISVVMVMVGIMGESLADIQLYRFKTRHTGGVCNTGLWHYSRHPNYFFDWLTWLGFAFFACQSHNGYLGMASPLILYFIFTQITGPITERGSVQSRGQQYRNYQKQTAMFFPGFKRKIDSE
jgi:steroid 5-alpha reductase family enzyme